MGDQRQLGQPTQGAHPAQSGPSVLDYRLGDVAAVEPEHGVFFGTTHRMHPAVNAPLSRHVYAGRLETAEVTASRVLLPVGDGSALDREAGIVFLPVEREGNVQASEQEVDAIVAAVKALTRRQLVCTDGSHRAVALADMLFVAPCNAQVARLKQALGSAARVGSVDRFHGAGSLSDDFEPWIVKFANSLDGPDAGAVEYVYAEMAKRAGLVVMDKHLFPARQGAGYFATKRFDRENGGRLHMHTACGLLHSDFRTPSLDYQDLIELTSQLTRDVRETEKMFRLAVFNVLAHNCDDHAKNFSFLMNETGEWTLSPAYDLTFSSGPGGEQSRMVVGEGKAPSPDNLLALGEVAGLHKSSVDQILDQSRAALADWAALAKEHDVKSSNIRLIGDRIGSNL